MNKILSILITIIILFGCNSNNEYSSDLEIPDSILNQKPLSISEETMESIIDNLSSPVEVAAMLKERNVPFEVKILSSTKNADDYVTGFKQAINLGILGTDLGYLCIYNKTGVIIDYLTTIKNLADKLKIGQFFDIQLLKRLASSSENFDSLTYVSVTNFNNIDSYLRKNNRSNVSTLIVTGVWIEGLYLAAQVVKDNPIQDIKDRIGEQKVLMNDILLIINNYKIDPRFAELSKDLEELKKEYEPVKITIEIGEPKSVEKNGMLMIVQNEKSIVTMSDAQLNRIILQIERIRNKLRNS